MSGLRRARWWGIGIALALGSIGAAWGLWMYQLLIEPQGQRQRLVEAEQQALRIEALLWIHELRIRSSFMERAYSQPLPPTLLRQADLRGALRALETQMNAAGLGNTPLLRELIERVLLIERRHAGWRRALERSERKEDYQIVLEQYMSEASGLLSPVETVLQQLLKYLQDHRARVEATHLARLQQARLVGGVALGVFLLGGIIGLLFVGRAEERHLREVLQAAARGEKVPVASHPWAPLAQAYNQLLHRWHSLISLLEALGHQKAPIVWQEHQKVLGASLPLLEGISQKIQQQSTELQKATEEARKLQQQLQAREKHFAEQVEALRLEVGAFQNLVPLAELDAQGAFLSKNDLFSQLPQATSWKHVREISPTLQAVVEKGEPQQGHAQAQEVEYVYYYLPYRLGRQQKALLSLVPLGDLPRRLKEAERALTAAQHRLQEVEAAHMQLRQQQQRLQGEYTQEVERLLRQRQSLQTLLKLPALQKGDVLAGLSAITEVAATLDPEARYSFWVFGENRETLHCLEAYDPTLLMHSNSVDLPEEAARWVQERLVATPVAGPHYPEVAPLQTYLKERKTQGLWLFPLSLDEDVTGVFFVERLSDTPLPDIEYPALLARVASLLLQQGHRKLVERELLSYLEQAQALEEELRQNIEELEASAEEMRRTQAELRGQITALNAAAIVAEINPDGRIIYVNDSFLRSFGYSAEDLLGQPYSRLRRGEEASLVQMLFERLKNGETWHEVVSYATRFGEELWLQQTLTPVRQVNGEIYKYILVAFDITLQKQQEAEIHNALLLAREQEQLLRENSEELRKSNENYRVSQLQLTAQLEALNNAAWLFETDSEGRLTYVTQSLAESLGHTEDQMLGAHYGTLFSNRTPIAVLQGHWRSMQSGQFWKSEVELIGSMGQSYWAIMSSTPILDRARMDKRTAVLKTVNVLFDITEQKEQEFRLKEQQNALSLLAVEPTLREGDITKAFQVIADIGMRTLQAYRVSLWLFEEPDMARCVAVAEKESHSHAAGTTVTRSLYPLYFQSLEREQVIAVVDALSDLRTRELALPLFKPNNVASVLDGVIRVGAKSVGLISVEHRYTRREWRLDEVNFLRALAASAASVIEEEQQAYARRLQEAYKQLEQQKHELEEAMRDIRESIRYAKRMQKNILPIDPLLDRYLGKDNYFIIWRPRDRNGVGGDFYWFSEVQGEYFIIVADGTGHGVPGAFMTLIGSILLDQIINKSRILSPAQILHDLHIGVRQVLRQDVEGEETPSRDGMDIALVRYNPRTFQLAYAGANLPLYYVQGTELKEIKPDKKSIGGEQLEEERFFTEHVIQLEPGDSFFLFTDGVVDQSGGPAGKRFGTKQLKEFILETVHEVSMPRRRALFNIRWKEWKDHEGEGEQIDDVTMWGVRVW